MDRAVAPWVRVGILVVAVVSLAIVSFIYTGAVLPPGPQHALVFQNALLLIVLGSAVLEYHYTKPADSMINALMGFITLLSVYHLAPRVPWLMLTGYCVVVFLLSMACVAVSSGKDIAGWRQRVAALAYRPAVVFGRSRVLFTVVFLGGIWFFFDSRDQLTLALITLWGFFLALWPLRIPELITAWFSRMRPNSSSVGEIIRMDSPNILRIALAPEAEWDSTGPKICALPNGDSFWVQPLFSQFQEGRLLATGLLTTLKAPVIPGLRNCVVEPEEVPAPPAEDVNEALGGGPRSSLVGFVVERSSIGAIRFETLGPEACHDGMLVWSEVAGERVYYQVVSGETQEESFAADKHGFQVASAAQVGILQSGEGFKKYEWLPAMNTPVFSSAPGTSVDVPAIAAGDFILGKMPKSEIRVGGDFARDYSHHTAILGVTGSGKTELAFDLIRHALSSGIKVVCIDLTNQYEGRLRDINPVDLSIDEATATSLGERLFEAETGEFGAKAEKRALGQFTGTLRDEITTTVEDFLTSQDDSLGLIRLEEISNTKATLWITELYMSCLLRYARENVGTCPRTLIVVEEAHTVMPEAMTMGLGDNESRGLVGKIAQIALQGRKYGVGLLILAQRTATVSKTVLTQCNTVISFACYDDTSLGFLRNIYGPEHVALIPDLPPLRGVAFGRWIRSQQPLVFEVPFDERKCSEAAPKADAVTE